jgi:hypothetical protein
LRSKQSVSCAARSLRWLAMTKWDRFYATLKTEN